MAEREGQYSKGKEDSGLSRGRPLGDSPLQISPVKLNGTNYLIWPRSCSLVIAARRLTGYITSSTKPLTEDSALSA